MSRVGDLLIRLVQRFGFLAVPTLVGLSLGAISSFRVEAALAGEPAIVASSLGAEYSTSEKPSNEYSVAMPTDIRSTETRNFREREAARLASHPQLKGWDHLYALLVDEGIEPAALMRVFTDARMPRREPLIYNLTPKESKSLYRGHINARNRANALRFYTQYEKYFRRAELTYGVPRSMILSLIQIETACGTNTGSERVVYRLARLAAAATPENINENYRQKKRSLKLVTFDAVKSRASRLQDIFLTHVAASFDVARSMGIHPLELRGSGAGAMGIPQFLPGNISLYGVDGDRDGRISVFSPADSILSVAKFLNAYGWKPGTILSTAKKREILHHYNRSDPYVTTALNLAKLLEQDIRKAASQ